MVGFNEFICMLMMKYKTSMVMQVFNQRMYQCNKMPRLSIENILKLNAKETIKANNTKHLLNCWFQERFGR